MADVNKIKLPDNSELNIKDYRIPGVDSTPTSGSNNVVTSGGIHTAMADTELVVATALNDLNDRVSDLEDGAETLESDSVWEAGTGTNSVIIKGSLGTAGGNYSTVEGKGCVSGGTHSVHDLTPDTADDTAGSYAHAEGRYTIACGKKGSHAEGDRTLASGAQSHAEGVWTVASGDYSHAEGGRTAATDYGAHAEGYNTISSSTASHAEGEGSMATGTRSHAEGYRSKATGFAAHAEGACSSAIGSCSHAEGVYGMSIGSNSHSETLSCAYGARSHSETGNKGVDIFPVGAANATSYTSTWDTEFDAIRNVIGDTVFCNILKASFIIPKNLDYTESVRITDASLSGSTLSLTTEKTLSETALDGSANYWICFSIAYGDTSHTENSGNIAYGEDSHSEGGYNVAQGKASHAEGWFTFTNNASEHAEGRYNLSTKTSSTYGNAGNTQHSIGIGTASARKNAFEIMQNGDAYLYGVGGYTGANYSSALSLQEKINNPPVTMTDDALRSTTGTFIRMVYTDDGIYAFGSANADGDEDEILATMDDIPDAVTANPTVPSGTTPTALTGLKVGSGYYSISSGGNGGSGGISEKTYAIPFGHVDSTSTSTVFTATVDNFPSTLSDGVCAYIYNGVVSSASGCTLNINNTGAKPIYGTMELETAVTTNFSVNYTMLFIYNSTRVSGGCWDMFYGYYTTTAYRMRFNNGTKTVTGATYRYRLLFTSADGTQWVPSNSSSSTNATASRTVSQTKIDPFGPIVYYANTTAISAGGSPGASYLNEQYVVTLGYSFNRTGAALVLTTKIPVYIKCAPQSDGSAIIDADTPYVQALPSTDDGKIYIYLGIAASATTVEVNIYHPVYYYKDSAIRLWTNAPSGSGGGLTGVTFGNTAASISNGVATISNGVVMDGYVAEGTIAAIEDMTGTVYGLGAMAESLANPDAMIMTTDLYSIPTESTVSGWGFTKNAGTVTGVKMNGTTNSPSSGVVDLGTVITSHQDISGKQDTIVSNSVITGVSSGGIRAIKGTDNKIYALSTLLTSPGDDYTLARLNDIPIVNNSTITIQKGGSTVDTFTTNDSSAKSINIPNELPSYSSSDSGKILSVNSSGNLVWLTPAAIRSGSGTPSNSAGNNGDIYVQT